MGFPLPSKMTRGAGTAPRKWFCVRQLRRGPFVDLMVRILVTSLIACERCSGFMRGIVPLVQDSRSFANSNGRRSYWNRPRSDLAYKGCHAIHSLNHWCLEIDWEAPSSLGFQGLGWFRIPSARIENIRVTGFSWNVPKGFVHRWKNNWQW